MKTFYLIVYCCFLTACTEREADIAFRTLHALAVTSVVAADIAAEIQHQNQQEVDRQIEQVYGTNHPGCQYEQFYTPREYGPPALCTKYQYQDCVVECDEWK